MDHDYNDDYFSASGEPAIKAQIQRSLIGPGEDRKNAGSSHTAMKINVICPSQ